MIIKINLNKKSSGPNRNFPKFLVTYPQQARDKFWLPVLLWIPAKGKQMTKQSFQMNGVNYKVSAR